mmetsp:Transcript_31037/g.89704  ORF Transcript_31037/g.89704 Transcript_31037/m.89704 type:complete len:222 (-) Transcript_31037:178-843(-)
MARPVPGADVATAAGPSNGAVAVPTIADIAQAADEHDVGPKLHVLALIGQGPGQRHACVENLALAGLLLHGVDLLLARHRQQGRGRLRLKEHPRRPLLRERERLPALGPLDERAQASPLAREDGVLDLGEVHPPAVVHRHTPQDVAHLLLCVPLAHGHFVQHLHDCLHIAPRPGCEGLEQRLAAIVLDHLRDLAVRVDVRAADAAPQEPALVRGPEPRIQL